MRNLYHLLPISFLATMCADLSGCASTNEPPGSCTPVDEAWLETTPRCGESSGLYLGPPQLPSLEGCQVLLGDVDYAYTRQAALPEFRGLRAVVGRFNLFGASELTDLSGLAGLEHVGTFLIRSARVSDLHGLGSLRSSAGIFVVTEMPNLASLDGVSALRQVEGNVEIRENPQLRSLRGLSALCRVGGDLMIYDNPQLPQSEIDWLLDRVEVGGRVVLAYEDR
jgi:hypothetical protein